jgi:hypothetical protein
VQHFLKLHLNLWSQCFARLASLQALEDAATLPPPARQAKLGSSAKYAGAIGNASAKVYRRCLGEIPGGTGNLAYPKAAVNDLGKHLIIEYKVIRVVIERNIL